MAAGTVIALAATELEDEHLLVAILRKNLALDDDLGQSLGVGNALGAVVEEQDVAKGDGLPLLGLELLTIAYMCKYLPARDKCKTQH